MRKPLNACSSSYVFIVTLTILVALLTHSVDAALLDCKLSGLHQTRAQQPFVNSAESPFDPLCELGSSQAEGFAHQSRLSSVAMFDDDDDPAASLQGSVPSSSLNPNTQAGRPYTRPAYEINRPPRILPERDGLRACTAKLVEYSFANSYGKPVVTKYAPELFTDDVCKDPTNWVFIQLDVQGYGKGRQFDRLGSVQLDGVEVLRHDNPEPSQKGTKWQFSKEMNRYYDLFRTKRTLVFDFPNIVNDIYVSPLDMILSLTAYVVDDAALSSPHTPLSQDYAVILPLSDQTRASKDNAFYEIGDAFGNPVTVGSTLLTIPHNARSALVEIYASGTAKDEFWYTNVANDDYEKLGFENGAPSYARGPLREVQLRIDGQLAGVVQPYAVIYTGGISPYFWRPQVGFGAYDQPSYLLDITPFLGTLTDDKEHEFGLSVVSAEKNQSVLAWFVTGNVQVKLDSTDERTTGELTLHEAPLSGDYIHHSVLHGNISEDGTFSAEVRTANPRTIRIEGTIKTGSSPQPINVAFTQSLTYSSNNKLANNTFSTQQSAQGSINSMHDGKPFLTYTFDFPLNISSVGTKGNLERGYHVDMSFGAQAAVTYKEPANQKIDMTQTGEAISVIEGNPPKLVSGSGEMFESYSYTDSDGYTFTRDNQVKNSTITFDMVSGTLKGQAVPIV